MAASQAYDTVVRSFTPVIGTSTEAPGRNTGVSVLAGNRYTLDGGTLFGMVGGLTWTHKYDLYLDGVNNNGTVSDPSQGVVVSKARTDSRGLDEVLLGILGTFVWQPNERHQYAVSLVGNQSAEDEARIQVQDIGYPSIEQNQSLHYVERTVGSLQGHGQHTYDDLFGTGGIFSDLRFDWTVSANYTRQDEPDVRFFRNFFDFTNMSASKPSNSTEAQNTRRIWRNIAEENGQAAFNLAFPFKGPGDAEGAIRVGAVTDLTDRTYDQTSYTYLHATQTKPRRDASQATKDAYAFNQNLGVSFTATSPDQLWTDVFLDPNRIGLASNNPPAANQLLWYASPLSGDDVNYTGDQTLGGQYVMGEVPLPGRVRLTAGVRREMTEIGVVPVNDLSGMVDVIEIQPDSGDRYIATIPQEDATASIDANRWLPAVSAVWEPKDGMNLRASWARTIARPTFRELAPVATEEFIFGDEYIGNPDLVLSDITNHDLRWEWFRKPGEVLAVSLFSKSITHPIEMISFSAGGRFFIQPVNYETGSVEGIELEVRVPLDNAADWLKGVAVGANAAFIDSVVQVPQDEQDSLASFGLAQDERRLQGQPESLYNLNLTWDSERLGTSAGVFWSRVGEVLVTGAARGEDGSPNVFEESYDTLDMTLGQKFKNGLAISLKGKNLTTPERIQVYRTPGCDGYGDLPCSEAVKTQRETAWILGLTIGYSW
jgi:TonB-dependent receptor